MTHDEEIRDAIMRVTPPKKYADALEILNGPLHERLLDRLSRGKDHMVLDFHDDVASVNLDFANEILDNPEESFRVLTASLRHMTVPMKKKRFFWRIKNLPRSSQVDVADVRGEYVDKLVSFIGIPVQKGQTEPFLDETLLQCKSCLMGVLWWLHGTKFSTPPACPSCKKATKWAEQDYHYTQSFVFNIQEERPKYGRLQPAVLYCLATHDLCNPEVYGRFGMTSKLKVTGVLRVKRGKGKEKDELTQFVEVNHIEVVAQSILELEMTEEEKQEIKDFAENTPDKLEYFNEKIFSEIEGETIPRRALLLQLFSGTNWTPGKRRNMHVLLVGDPGVAKSVMIKKIAKIMPKSIYTTGAGISGVGLTAAVTHDPIFGKLVLQPGALPLAHKGLACIDELDKADEEDLGGLNEAMEQQTVSISKGGIIANLPAETCVLAACNPKYGAFDDALTIFEQIEISSSLLTRFDVIFIMRRKNDPKVWEAIMRKIYLADKKRDEWNPKELRFLRNYIQTAWNIDVNISEELAKIMWIDVIDIMKSVTGNTELRKMPFTPRMYENYSRMVMAHSRMNLRAEATLQDLEIAKMILQASIESIAKNPYTGKLDFEMLSTGGASGGKKNLLYKMIAFIRERGALVPFTDIIKEFKDEQQELIEEYIDKLKNDATIVESKPGQYLFIGG